LNDAIQNHIHHPTKESIMSYHVLIYHVVDGFVEKRDAHREEHLRLAEEAAARGELQLGGALGDPPDRALMVFRAPNARTVEEFARRDPYVRHGLVRRWEVLPWAVVVGEAYAR
jgi:uncharacterized protein YciI